MNGRGDAKSVAKSGIVPAIRYSLLPTLKDCPGANPGRVRKTERWV